MNDKWLNDLREHLDGYEQPAPENLWERIAEAMPSAKPDPAPALSRKIIPLWSKRAAAAAAAIAVVATVGYGWLTRNDSAPQPISVQYADNTPAVEQSPQPLFNGSAQLATQQNVSEIASAQKHDRAVSAKLSATAAAARTAVFAQAAQQLDSPSATELQATQNIDTQTDRQTDRQVDRPKAEMQSTDQPANEQISTPKDKASKQEERNARRSIVFGDTPKSSANRRNTATKLTANLFASGITSSSTSRQSVGGVLLSAVEYKESPNRDEYYSDPLTAILLYNVNRSTETDIKHRQPLKFGFTVRYNITPALGIESGLTYSKLASTVNSGSIDCYYSEHRNLNYLGIPLNLTYNLWASRRLTLYISGGAALEKCIAGRSRTDYIFNGNSESVKRGDISIDPLQWSLNASLGLQYNISHRIGLYAEAGLGYYFDNGSHIETIYSKRPLNPNFNFGVRISLK